MSRRILTGRAPSMMAGSSGASGVDDYLGRLVKYIPAEIVGFYLTAAGIIPQGPNKEPNYTALWIVFALGLVLVPVYFWFATTRGGTPPLWSQVILATVAYPVWVFAIGGPFASLDWYKSWIASLVLLFVTVVFAMYKPPQGS